MFDSYGKPTGYDQIAPGRDQQKMTPLQSAVGPQQQAAGGPPTASNYPSDPSMTAWRNKTPGSSPKIQPRQFIADWQQRHSPSEGIGPMAAAAAQQFPDVSRFMYGATPSNNELNLGGEKFKVLGGEGTPGAYWYKPGTNDGPAARPNPLFSAIQPQQQQEQPYYQTLLQQLMHQIQ